MDTIKIFFLLFHGSPSLVLAEGSAQITACGDSPDWATACLCSFSQVARRRSRVPYMACISPKSSAVNTIHSVGFLTPPPIDDRYGGAVGFP